jgi:hypothetical protein
MKQCNGCIIWVRCKINYHKHYKDCCERKNTKETLLLHPDSAENNGCGKMLEVDLCMPAWKKGRKIFGLFIYSTMIQGSRHILFGKCWD